jgi:hypothetical protein
VEGAFVGGCVAQVEGKALEVVDWAGIRLEAGLLEAGGAVEEPAVLGHAED